MIRVLVVDDHPVVRSGIAGLLETEPDFVVVAAAASGEQALTIAAEHELDIVLMDLRMPGMGGVEATRQLIQGRGGGISSAAEVSAQSEATFTGPRVLVFTTYEEDDQILAAIEAGAAGYLLKAAPAEELIAGVRGVVAGQTVLAPSVAAQLVARATVGRERGASSGEPPIDAEAPVPCASAAADGDPPRLTAREAEILGLVANGLSNPEIAVSLFIGESTVKTHLLHVFEKLEVSDRTRAVTRAMELGLL